MDHFSNLERTVANGVRQGKIAGVRELVNIMRLVFEDPILSQQVYTPEKIMEALDKAADGYELRIRRMME